MSRINSLLDPEQWSGQVLPVPETDYSHTGMPQLPEDPTGDDVMQWLGQGLQTTSAQPQPQSQPWQQQPTSQQQQPVTQSPQSPQPLQSLEQDMGEDPFGFVARSLTDWSQNKSDKQVVADYAAWIKDRSYRDGKLLEHARRTGTDKKTQIKLWERAVEDSQDLFAFDLHKPDGDLDYNRLVGMYSLAHRLVRDWGGSFHLGGDEDLAAIPQEDRELFSSIVADVAKKEMPKTTGVQKSPERVRRGWRKGAQSTARFLFKYAGTGGMPTSVSREKETQSAKLQKYELAEWIHGVKDLVMHEGDPAKGENFVTEGILAAGEMAPAMAVSSLIPAGASGKAALALQTAFWTAQIAPDIEADLVNRGVSREIAGPIALGAGIIEGAIENLNMRQLLGPEIKKLGQGGIKRLLKESLKQYGTEYSEEVLQALVELGAKRVATWTNEDAHFDWAEEGQELWSTAKDTLLPLGLLMAPGSVARLPGQVRAAKQRSLSKTQAELLRKLGPDIRKGLKSPDVETVAQTVGQLGPEVRAALGPLQEGETREQRAEYQRQVAEGYQRTMAEGTDPERAAAVDDMITRYRERQAAREAEAKAGAEKEAAAKGDEQLQPITPEEYVKLAEEKRLKGDPDEEFARLGQQLELGMHRDFLSDDKAATLYYLFGERDGNPEAGREFLKKRTRKNVSATLLEGAGLPSMRDIPGGAEARQAFADNVNLASGYPLDVLRDIARRTSRGATEESEGAPSTFRLTGEWQRFPGDPEATPVPEHPQLQKVVTPFGTYVRVGPATGDFGVGTPEQVADMMAEMRGGKPKGKPKLTPAKPVTPAPAAPASPAKPSQDLAQDLQLLGPEDVEKVWRAEVPGAKKTAPGRTEMIRQIVEKRQGEGAGKGGEGKRGESTPAVEGTAPKPTPSPQPERPRTIEDARRAAEQAKAAKDVDAYQQAMEDVQRIRGEEKAAREEQEKSRTQPGKAEPEPPPKVTPGQPKPKRKLSDETTKRWRELMGGVEDAASRDYSIALQVYEQRPTKANGETLVNALSQLNRLQEERSGATITTLPQHIADRLSESPPPLSPRQPKRRPPALQALIDKTFDRILSRNNVALVEAPPPNTPWSRLATSFAEAVADKYGRDKPTIVWYKPKAPTTSTYGTAPHGLHTEGVIFISTTIQGEDMFWDTVAHEIAHAMQLDRIPLSQSTMDQMQEEYLQATGEGYREYLEQHPDDLRRESVAMFIGRLFQDPDFRRQVQQENPKFWDRVVEILRELFERIGLDKLLESVKGQQDISYDVYQVYEAFQGTMKGEGKGKGKGKGDGRGKGREKGRGKVSQELRDEWKEVMEAPSYQSKPKEPPRFTTAAEALVRHREILDSINSGKVTTAEIEAFVGEVKRLPKEEQNTFFPEAGIAGKTGAANRLQDMLKAQLDMWVQAEPFRRGPSYQSPPPQQSPPPRPSQPQPVTSKSVLSVAQSLSSDPGAQWLSPQKILISEVYKAGNFTGTLEQFKRELLRMHREDELTLGRSDLITGADKDKFAKVQESSTEGLGPGEFHFVRVEPTNTIYQSPPSQPSRLKPRVSVADLSSIRTGSYPGLTIKAHGAYSFTEGVQLDSESVKNMTPEERARVVRHELAHQVETESDLWQDTDSYLWELWKKHPGHPIFYFMGDVTTVSDFDNTQGTEIIAELYASHYPKGTYTAEVTEGPWADEDAEGPREFPIPPQLMEVLDKIEDKLGIWEKKKTRRTSGPSYQIRPGDQTDTPEFKRWFGNSKVVDKSGKPLVVYHGTKANFEAFDPSTKGRRDMGYHGSGFYFSSSPVSAEMYSGMWDRDPTGANIVPVYLKIENPYIADVGKAAGKYSHLPGPEATKAMIKDGYDGAIISASGNLKEYVVFHPTQIKSATGNQGTFDPDNQDIRYSPAPLDPARQKQFNSVVANSIVEGGIDNPAQLVDLLREELQFTEEKVREHRLYLRNAWEAAAELDSELDPWSDDVIPLAAWAALPESIQSETDDALRSMIDQFRGVKVGGKSTVPKNASREDLLTMAAEVLGYAGKKPRAIVFPAEPAAEPTAESKAKPKVESKAKPEPPPPTKQFAPLRSGSFVEVPTSSLKIDPQRFQFKGGVTAEGVVEGEKLQGKYNKLAAGALLVWEDKSGQRYVVNGHHRFDLAVRTGEPSVAIQLIREEDGYSERDARAIGAELNILEGQGTVDDYATFFRNNSITEGDAEQRGLLARVKGRTGFLLGRFASDDVWAAFKAGHLSADRAAAIADVGRGDDGIQAVGIKKAREGMPADQLRFLLQAAQDFPRSNTGKQGDLFGFDDSAMVELERVSAAAAEIVSELKDRLLAVQGALRRPETAKRMGLSGDFKEIQGEADRIRAELSLWGDKRWNTNRDLMRQARIRAGLSVKEEVSEGARQGPKEGQRTIFGDIEEPAAKKPEPFGSEVKEGDEEGSGSTTQPNLFSTKGAPGQQNLFSDTGVPDSMVGETEAQRIQRKADESRPSSEGYGIVGGGTVIGERIREDQIPESVKAPRQDVEKRLVKARGSRRRPILDSIKEAVALTWRVFTRAQEHLPNNEKYAPANEFFRLLRNVGQSMQDEAIRTVGAIVDPLGKNQILLLERALIAENQLAALQMGQPLRFGFENAEEVEAYRDQLRRVVSGTPEVAEAIESRKRVVREVVEKLVQHKLLPEKALDNVETYYHQQVHFYLQLQQSGVTGLRPGKITRSFQRKRVEGDELGEELDYNTSYIEAETAWLSDALVELEKERLLQELVDHYDIKDDLREKAKRLNFENLVGGPEIANRIEYLRGVIAESQASEDSQDSGERIQRRIWIEELQRIDPTYPYRQQIAMMAAILRRRLGLDVDENYDANDDVNDGAWFAIVKEQAELGDPAALGYLKAITERNEFIKEKLGSKYQTWRDLAVKDGYAIWQPEPGNLFYRAFTIPERLAERLQEGVVESISKDDVRQALAMAGPKRQFAMPADLVLELEKTKKGELPHGLAVIADELMRDWKVWTLLSPRRLIGYSLRNITGDIEPTISANPGVVKYTMRALQELRRYHGAFLSLTPELRAARDLGVIGSGFTAEEIPDLRDLRVFQRFFEGYTKRELVTKAPAKYFETVKKYNEYRENSLRYAAFLYYVDELRNNRLKNYGGSRKAVVKQLQRTMGVEVAAAHLARNLIGDYGNITVAGNWIRKRMKPFWSFQEINLKRTPRLAINALTSGRPGAAGMILTTGVARAIVTSRIAWMYGAVWAFNNLVSPLMGGDDDDEGDLPPYDRANLNVMLGRNADGSIRRFRNVGALHDFLEWFGLNEAVSLFQKYSNDQITEVDIAKEMIKAPLEKSIGSLRPEVSTAFGLAGLSLFPEPLSPKSARRDEAIPNALGLVDEYKWMKGKVLKDGSRPRKYYWQRWLLGVSDPRQDALSNIYELRNDFMKKKGSQEKAIYPISRYKEARDAVIREDYDAFVEWKDKFIDDFGDESSRVKFKAFLQTIDPVASQKMSAKERVEFEMEFLTNEQRGQLQVARQYAAEMRDTLLAWWDASESKQPGKLSLREDRLSSLAYNVSRYTKPNEEQQAAINKAAKEILKDGATEDELIDLLTNKLLSQKRDKPLARKTIADYNRRMLRALEGVRSTTAATPSP